jgi:hypothetical protein
MLGVRRPLVKAISFLLATSVLFSTAALADNKRVPVPSDVRAKYMIIDKGWVGADRIVVTKRVAREGTTFTKRRYNCEKNTVTSLGEASSKEALETVAAADGKMVPIAPESVAYYISLEACKYLTES